MAKQFLSPIGLPSGTADPSGASEGDLFYRTDLGKIRLYRDSAWASVEGAVDLIDGGSPSSDYENVAVGGANQDSGWTAITSFSNSYSGGNSPAYRKINDVVYLRGRVSGGTAGATAFTLPEGYRPSIDVVVPAQKFGTSELTYVTVYTTGVVTPNSDAAWLSSVIFPVG